MAKNLHATLPANDTLYIHDIIPETLTKFRQEVRASNQSGAEIRIVENVRDISEDAVSLVIPNYISNIGETSLDKSCISVCCNHLLPSSSWISFVYIYIASILNQPLTSPVNNHNRPPGTLTRQNRLLPTPPTRLINPTYPTHQPQTLHRLLHHRPDLIPRSSSRRPSNPTRKIHRRPHVRRRRRRQSRHPNLHGRLSLHPPPHTNPHPLNHGQTSLTLRRNRRLRSNRQTSK